MRSTSCSRLGSSCAAWLPNLPRSCVLGNGYIGPDEKGLERLLDRLLAVENGIFGRGRLCRQVDSGVSQIVRRFASPRCRVRQPPGIRLHTTACPPAERSKAERLASGGGRRIRRASKPAGPPPLRAATTPDTQDRGRALAPGA